MIWIHTLLSCSRKDTKECIKIAVLLIDDKRVLLLCVYNSVCRVFLTYTYFVSPLLNTLLSTMYDNVADACFNNNYICIYVLSLILSAVVFLYIYVYKYPRFPFLFVADCVWLRYTSLATTLTTPLGRPLCMTMPI